MAGRNPFFYSGHFNELGVSRHREVEGIVAIPSFIQGISTGGAMGKAPHTSHVAIPSFIQGISTCLRRGNGKSPAHGRNPFFYSGHFNKLEEARKKGSLWGVAIPSFIQGISTHPTPQKLLIRKLSRNPFFYSGHFNTKEGEMERIVFEKSQSLLLFRAFQQTEVEVVD